MKNCKNCGAEMADDALFCTGCGQKFEEVVEAAPATEKAEAPKSGTDLSLIALILLIVGTVSMAFATFGLGLIWCIPMTIHYNNARKNRTPVSMTYKICVLLFVSTISGILMLIDKDL